MRRKPEFARNERRRRVADATDRPWIVRGARVALTNGTIGLISDTHGLVRPQAIAAMQGVDVIIHAGDIGNAAVLGDLRRIAPVHVIRGNNDRGPWADALPDILNLRCGEVGIQIIHDVHDLDVRTAGEYDVIVSGHSHKPGTQERNGTLYVNPGSAGPRRFKLPVAVGRLRVAGTRVKAEIIELDP